MNQKPEHFPWHYRERERTRRMNLLRLNQFPSEFRVGIDESNVLDKVRDGVFRVFWQLPPNFLIDLSESKHADEEYLLDCFNGPDYTQDELMSLVVCLRYNRLFSPASLAVLISTFTPVSTEEEAPYRDVVFIRDFINRYRNFFDEVLLANFESSLQEMVAKLPMTVMKHQS